MRGKNNLGFSEFVGPYFKMHEGRQFSTIYETFTDHGIQTWMIGFDLVVFRK